jgi:hypothetical protein
MCFGVYGLMKEVKLSTLQKNDLLVGSSKVTLKEVLHENKGNGMKKTYMSMSLMLHSH